MKINSGQTRNRIKKKLAKPHQPPATECQALDQKPIS